MTTVKSSHTLLLLIALCHCFGTFTSNGQSLSNGDLDRQVISIKMVDAHSGKPVAHECINVSFGAWHGADTYLQTGSDGIVKINREVKAVPSGSSLDQPCKKQPSTETVDAGKLSRDISVLPAWYVMCQFPKNAEHHPKWLAQSPAERIGSYSVTDIVKHGIVTANNCSKLVVQPTPGQLTVVVRNRTLLEGMRS